MKKYSTLGDLFEELTKDPEFLERYNQLQPRYDFLQWLVNHRLGWLVERLYFMLYGR